MGAEAGQSLDAIIHRKELERSASNGTFVWGIGNSLGTSAELAKKMSPNGEVDVLFTPMKSQAKTIDSAPSEILLWLSYYDRNGHVTDLPQYTMVTSRGGSKRAHYALLCYSDKTLADHTDLGSFDAAYARNLASLNPIGASQVTSIVKYDNASCVAEKPYRIAFKGKLHKEGFVRLASPVVLDTALMALYHDVCRASSVREWQARLEFFKEEASHHVRGETAELF